MTGPCLSALLPRPSATHIDGAMTGFELIIFLSCRQIRTSRSKRWNMWNKTDINTRVRTRISAGIDHDELVNLYNCRYYYHTTALNIIYIHIKRFQDIFPLITRVWYSHASKTKIYKIYFIGINNTIYTKNVYLNVFQNNNSNIETNNF